jgi:outer membrane protein assembly factor BamB
VVGRSPQIIVGTRNGEVVSHDGLGKQRWKTRIGGWISAWPVVTNLPNLGTSILASNEDGVLGCLSPRGKLLWKTEIEAPVHPWNSISLVMDRRDPRIVVTDRHGGLTALDERGEPKWRFHTHSGGAGPAAVGDIDGDGSDEILFCCGEGRLYCLDARGRYRWNVGLGDPSEYSAPVLGDLGNGPCVLTGSMDDHLRCVSPMGQVLWKQRGTGVGSIEVGLSLGDINGDATDELVYCHMGTGLQALDGDGNLLWNVAYGGGDQPFGPSIGDIDGDGQMELLLAQRAGPAFRVLSHTGLLLEEHDLPGGMLGGPVIGDVDGDGLVEVVVMSRETGELICFETGTPLTPQSVPWPNSRGGFDTRGNRLGKVRRARRQRPAGVGPTGVPRPEGGLRVGKNLIAFSRDGRWRRGCSVEVGVGEQGGFVQRAVLHRRSEKAKFEILEPGRKLLTAREVDSRGRETGRTQRSLRLSPFRDDVAVARQLIRELEGLSKELPDLEDILRRKRMEWAFIEGQITAYSGMGKMDRRGLIGRVARFLARSRREVGCQTMRAGMVGPDGPPAFLAWKPRHPWTPFDPETDHPSGKSIGKLRLLTDGRSHEVLMIQVANLLAEGLSIRAWFDPLVSREGEERPAERHLILRRVAWIPTASHSMGADALPELGNAGLLKIEPSSSERVWVEVSTGQLPRGEFSSVLHLRALVPEERLLDIPVKWRVTGPPLPAEMPLKFCNWGYVHSSPLKSIQEASVRDMQEHHTSVFVLTGEWTPRITYDVSGNLVEIDWRRFDWILERLRPRDMVLLIGGTPSPERGAGGEDSPEWMEASRRFFPMLVERLARHGLGYDRWAFYPVDEPGLRGGKLIDILESRARAYKSVDPRIQVYTDPVRGMRLEDLKRVLPLVDIFQPNFLGLVQKPTRKRVEYLLGTGKTVWTYDCSGEVKDMVGVRYYWEQVWTAWELGMTGIGFWSYCTRPYDLWQGPNPRENDWELVYQGSERPVPSLRWEAIRIAIEDHARLYRLRDFARRAAAAGHTDDARESERVLDDIVSRARACLWDPEDLARLRRRLILENSKRI